MAHDYPDWQTRWPSGPAAMVSSTDQRTKTRRVQCGYRSPHDPSTTGRCQKLLHWLYVGQEQLEEFYCPSHRRKISSLAQKPLATRLDLMIFEARKLLRQTQV